MKKLKLSIEGMHCASCSGNIQKSLMKISGVKSAQASVLMKSGKVEVDDKVNIEEIKKAVEKIGYKVTKITEEN